MQKTIRRDPRPLFGQPLSTSFHGVVFKISHDLFSSRQRQRFFAGLVFSLTLPLLAQANVKLPLFFSDHMVLQRDMKVPVWGTADPGEDVTVTFGDKNAETKADANGKWRVDLDPSPANATSQTLTVKGNNTVVFSDILVGDVWICSGQSNMGIQLGESYHADTDVPAANDPLLRLFKVSDGTSIKPEEDVELVNKKQWLPCTPDEAKQFTAVGYFYGRELRKDINIPIGLIASIKGGTTAQLWTPVEAIEKNVDADPAFKDWLTKRQQTIDAYPQAEAAYLPIKAKYDQDMKDWWTNVGNAPDYVAAMKAWNVANDQARAAGNPPLPKPQPSQPRPVEPVPPDGGPFNDYMVGTLFNAMIAPLIPMAIKGVIWYQGESNGDHAKQYGVLFPSMITGWREKWGQGDFPFLFMQLPLSGKPATEPVPPLDKWPVLRESQAKALALPNTGMAVIIDVGDPYNVHGKDKYDPGYRLSLIGRHVVYGENIVYTGPTYDSMKVDGNKIVISFKNIGSGLVIGTAPWTPSGQIPPVADELKGFAIAGDDKKWVQANAQIVGDTVEVSSDQVPNPVAVRYGWADNPPCNLYNQEKLPAAPFRTDDWEP